ncbi:hypothetical protein Nepgr_022869 [Nepenthes gracilis]|uniref:Uncharacterized protein n=1 Tax=Nepenthes gracilis TaxID=150966 RepID=A0AAD3XX74_NEPGR|nr:hypothetical protein Nepgr_022869 [Nepenthes gracilis]
MAIRLFFVLLRLLAYWPLDWLLAPGECSVGCIPPIQLLMDWVSAVSSYMCYAPLLFLLGSIFLVKVGVACCWLKSGNVAGLFVEVSLAMILSTFHLLLCEIDLGCVLWLNLHFLLLVLLCIESAMDVVHGPEA